MSALATLPVFSKTDIQNARRWALSYGEPIGERGRMPHWLLMDWHKNLRPIVALPETPAKPRKQRAAYVARVDGPEGVTVALSKPDASMARRWALANDIDVPARGRMPKEVLQKWFDLGKPTVDIAPVEKATVYYVKKNVVTGNLYSKIHAITVYDNMLPSGVGRPPMGLYWSVVRKQLPASAVPVRITTPGMIIDVSIDPDTHEYVYRWVSKRDSATVMRTLIANLAVHED